MPESDEEPPSAGKASPSPACRSPASTSSPPAPAGASRPSAHRSPQAPLVRLLAPGGPARHRAVQPHQRGRRPGRRRLAGARGARWVPGGLRAALLLLHSTGSLCHGLLYAAVPAAGADAPGQLATMMCCTLACASVCGTGTDAAVGPAIMMCHLSAVHALLRLASLLGRWLCNTMQ